MESQRQAYLLGGVSLRMNEAGYFHFQEIFLQILTQVPTGVWASMFITLLLIMTKPISIDDVYQLDTGCIASVISML